MEYTALYRKYRPTVFEDIRGQDIIVRTLQNQVRTGRIGHAYLFCGSRGTGKTTAAKIFARAVNCTDLHDGSPCGVCENCRRALAGSSMDVIEIDAASRNGVGDFRQIIEEIEYPPTDGNYKVYIIDEVHMLSTAAFNAFLKTLEEPPSYVIFILATTDPQKLPATILSRCQRYDFRRIRTDVIADRLREILEKEGITADEDAVRCIARKAEGGMRDALSITDQCISFYSGQTLTLEMVLDVLGTEDQEVYSRLVRLLHARDVTALMRQVDELVMKGRDLRQLVSDLIWYLRNLLLFKASDQSAESLDLPQEAIDRLTEEAALIPEDEVMRDLTILSELAGALRGAVNRRVQTEMTLIRICRPESDRDYNALLARLRVLEEMAQSGALAMASAAGPGGAAGAGQYAGAGGAGAAGGAAYPGAGNGAGGATGGAGYPGAGTGNGAGTAAGVMPDLPTSAPPEQLAKVASAWRKLVRRCRSPFVAAILSRSELKYRDGEEDVLYVVFPDFLGDRCREDPAIEAELQDMIAEKFGFRPKLRFLVPGEDAGLRLGKLAEEKQREEAVKAMVDFDVEVEDGE